MDDTLTFDEQILAAAKSIASAVQTLVKAASAAQRELVAQGRYVYLSVSVVFIFFEKSLNR